MNKYKYSYTIGRTTVTGSDFAKSEREMIAKLQESHDWPLVRNFKLTEVVSGGAPENILDDCHHDYPVFFNQEDQLTGTQLIGAGCLFSVVVAIILAVVYFALSYILY